MLQISCCSRCRRNAQGRHSLLLLCPPGAQTGEWGPKEPVPLVLSSHSYPDVIVPVAHQSRSIRLLDDYWWSANICAQLRCCHSSSVTPGSTAVFVQGRQGPQPPAASTCAVRSGPHRGGAQAAAGPCHWQAGCHSAHNAGWPHRRQPRRISSAISFAFALAFTPYTSSGTHNSPVGKQQNTANKSSTSNQ
jgi:hypothetical protein